MATYGTILGVPNSPKTPKHGLRVPDHEWELWKQAAEVKEMTLTDYIRSTMTASAKRVLRGRGD